MDYQGDALRLLGSRIMELRQERQLSIDQLAGLTGLEPTALVAIEAGQIDLPITTIFGLGKAFGITVEQFLDFLP